VPRQKVYLVFFGNDWGEPTRDGAGNYAFANDPKKLAPYVQKMFKGLGTAGELWSGVMTQYCDFLFTKRPAY
jgi:serine protease